MPATSGENRASAVAEAPGGSTIWRPAPPAGLTCVGSGVPLAPEQRPLWDAVDGARAAEVFFTVSVYPIWPAPALLGITENAAARSIPGARLR